MSQAEPEPTLLSVVLEHKFGLMLIALVSVAIGVGLHRKSKEQREWQAYQFQHGCKPVTAKVWSCDGGKVFIFR